MLIVNSAKSGKFYIVEFIDTNFIYSKVDEDFALTSKIKTVTYEGGPFWWDFRRFVLENKPA